MPATVCSVPCNILRTIRVPLTMRVSISTKYVCALPCPEPMLTGHAQQVELISLEGYLLRKLCSNWLEGRQLVTLQIQVYVSCMQSEHDGKQNRHYAVGRDMHMLHYAHAALQWPVALIFFRPCICVSDCRNRRYVVHGCLHWSQQVSARYDQCRRSEATTCLLQLAKIALILVLRPWYVPQRRAATKAYACTSFYAATGQYPPPPCP